jgi:hypothetical protein
MKIRLSNQYNSRNIKNSTNHIFQKNYRHTTDLHMYLNNLNIFINYMLFNNYRKFKLNIIL